MVDSVEAPDDTTIVFNPKFPSGAFLPALATPFNWIYSKRTCGHLPVVVQDQPPSLPQRARSRDREISARASSAGPHQRRDFEAEHDFDFIARDFLDLAAKLGCIA